MTESKLQSLFNRLDALLGIDSSPAAPAPEAEPAFELSTETTEALKKAQSVLMVLMKQVVALSDRMALLRAACEEAGIMPQTGGRVHPELVLQVPAIAAVLRADPQAARLVASAVTRFTEARGDLKELTEAIGSGTVSRARVDQIAMKYVFLCRSAVYFKGVPVVNRLFANLEDLGAAKPADAAAGPRPDVGPAPTDAAHASRMGLDGKLRVAPRPPNTGSLPGGDQLVRQPAPAPPPPRPSVPGRPVGRPGSDQLLFGSARPGLKPATASSPEAMAKRMAEQGQVFLKALEVKVAILQVAYDQARGVERATAPLLPVPAQKTARNVAAELKASPGLQPLARQYIQLFLEARGVIPPKSDAQRARAGKLLADLGTFPHRFKGHVVLEQLFLVSA